MDVVLEVFDTFLFDRVYAALLPGPQSRSDLRIVPNGTFTSAYGQPTAYVYRPASQLLAGKLEPSQYAYQSAWPRDSIYRQSLSLYIITAYVVNRILFQKHTDGGAASLECSSTSPLQRSRIYLFSTKHNSTTRAI